MFDNVHKIISDKKLHSRFLNTLAMMEFIGAQKISRSFSFLPQSLTILEHVNEEYRHAYFLRSHALRLDDSNDSFGPLHTMNFHRSLSYIGKLDGLIARRLKKHYGPLYEKKWPYLLTTYAIEKRALPFYEAYQTVLSACGSSIKVQSVIAEEKSHLKAIERELHQEQIPQTIIDEALLIEGKLFKRWLDGLASSLANEGA